MLEKVPSHAFFSKLMHEITQKRTQADKELKETKSGASRKDDKKNRLIIFLEYV